MAKVIGNHLFGLISGRIGNMVGVIINGKQHFRQLPIKNTAKPSQKQIIQRARFGFAMKFLNPLNSVIRIGFKSSQNSKSPQNRAMSLLLNNVIEGEYPDYTINFEKLQLSKGPIELCDSAIVKIKDQNIVYHWEDSEEIIDHHKKENALLVAITHDYQVMYSINEYTRNDQTGKLSLPEVPSGTKIHCYLAFVDTAHSQISSNSKYLGMVTMP